MIPVSQGCYELELMQVHCHTVWQPQKGEKLPVTFLSPSGTELDEHFNPDHFYLSILKPGTNTGPLDVGT